MLRPDPSASFLLPESLVIELFKGPPSSFHPAAEEEMNYAAKYFEDRASGLGFAFLDEIDRAVRRISETPTTWPNLSDEVRRFLLNIFPFGILYRIEQDEILILAIMHL